MIIEIDGDSHGDPNQANDDAKRARWRAEEKQYQVIQFWDTEILHDVESVLAQITDALEIA